MREPFERDDDAAPSPPIWKVFLAAVAKDATTKKYSDLDTVFHHAVTILVVGCALCLVSFMAAVTVLVIMALARVFGVS